MHHSNKSSPDYYSIYNLSLTIDAHRVYSFCLYPPGLFLPKTSTKNGIRNTKVVQKEKRHFSHRQYLRGKEALIPRPLLPRAGRRGVRKGDLTPGPFPKRKGSRGEKRPPVLILLPSPRSWGKGRGWGSLVGNEGLLPIYNYTKRPVYFPTFRPKNPSFFHTLRW